MVESTLIGVGMKVILFQLFENVTNISSILFGCRGIDKDIIHISDIKLIKVFMED